MNQLTKIKDKLSKIGSMERAGLPYMFQFLTPRFGYTDINQFVGTSGGSIICTVLYWMFTVAIIGSVIAALIAAFKYLTAAGEPEKVKSAHGTLIYAAVGAAVAIIAKSIPLIVGNFFSAGPGRFC